MVKADILENLKVWPYVKAILPVDSDFARKPYASLKTDVTITLKMLLEEGVGLDSQYLFYANYNNYFYANMYFWQLW